MLVFTSLWRKEVGSALISTQWVLQDLPRCLRLQEASETGPEELLPWVYVPIGCRSPECNQISCSTTDRSTPEPLEDGNCMVEDCVQKTQLDKAVCSATDPAALEQISGLCRPAQLRKCGAMWLDDSRILSCHSSVLMQRNLLNQTSRCLLGHNSSIEFLETASEVGLAATVENESDQPVIRIWKLPPTVSDSEDIRCIAIVQSVTLERISLLRLDPRGRYMVLVGLDHLGRQQLQVWELHGLLTTGSPNLLARQVSDFQIEALRISPLEELRLVSCGKENVRFWRIKNAHLPGCNVALDGLGRGSLFTDLAFVLPQQLQQLTSPICDDLLFLGGESGSMAKLLVSSTCGSLLQIDYFTRALKRVFSLHQSPIWAISTGPGFCVTASADKTVKVWPLNFATAYYSAGHNAACVGIETSPNGQQVLCTCADSTVELFDLTKQHHIPISRAHPARVLSASISASLRELYTICEDSLVRVWNLPELQQTFELESPHDPPLCVAAHPTQRVVALGFKSGSVRVLAVEGPTVWMEANHHTHPITGLWFVDMPTAAFDQADTRVLPSPSQQQEHQRQSSCSTRNVPKNRNKIPWQCSLLISLDAIGCMCIFSELHEFSLIRKLEDTPADAPPEGVPAIVFAAHGCKAVQYCSSRKLCLYSLPNFDFEYALNPFSTACNSLSITAFIFSTAGDSLCVCGSDSKMRLFTLQQEEGTTVLRQCRVFALLSGPISTAWVSSATRVGSGVPPAAVTCGADDRLIRVWSLAEEPPSTREAPSQKPGGIDLWGKKSADSALRRCSCTESTLKPTTNNSSSFDADDEGLIVTEFPQFHSFAGHNKSPFMLQALGDYFVSVSATETIVWKVGSSILSNAADSVPLDCCKPVMPPREASPSSKRVLGESASQEDFHEALQHLQPQQPLRPHPKPLEHANLQPLERPLPMGYWGPQGRSAPSASLRTSQCGSPTSSTALVGAAQPQPGMPNGKQSADATLVAVASTRQPVVPRASPAAAVDSLKALKREAGTIAEIAAVHTENGPLVATSTTAVDVTPPNKDTGREEVLVEGEEASVKSGNLSNVQVFQRTAETKGGFEASTQAGSPVMVSQDWQELANELGIFAHGVLAYAVGRWILIERLGTDSASQNGRCLGLLPTLLERATLTNVQKQGPPAESSMRRGPLVHGTQPQHPQRHMRRAKQHPKELVQQCRLKLRKPRMAVLKHPAVGRSIAFCLDKTTRVAATISAPESEAALGSGCWGLCVWKTEGSGELLGVSPLPSAYGAGRPFSLETDSVHSIYPSQAAEGLPAVIFCGTDYIVTAGGAAGGRMDVWRASEFVSAPRHFSSVQPRGNAPVEAAHSCSDTARQGLGACCCRARLAAGELSLQLPLGPAAAVGANLDVTFRRILSASSRDEREVVLVSARSVTLWRIVSPEGGKADPRKDCKPDALELQFQYTRQPRRLLLDPLENYTTACLTRRGKNTPRLLLVASDRGYVYGYDYEANVFSFELLLGDFCISRKAAL
ncbi:wd g-beta repeat-containing protein [Cyclospora cayetanensis]|uniref:Wd g-beta repeat-containing protein n=1 Tax=Cyclospora cayetanensis TaxID=88456 RepID=A0A1D3D1D0_9EIME|nr:wd g-beta repeat-containing protein [Cyclospora cayetanensis]